ncbi:Mpo1-like protein [Roseiarcus sp.]|uniref:Mpo1-like protein n=1 Tax=Roseiarcus sp. TaxID=1969460 RepID=UPI003F9EB762
MSEPASAESQHFATFRDFYPFYLGEHRSAVCRRLHVIGSALVLVALAAAITTRNPWLMLLMPVIGYGFAWVGHFFFEKNKPATFTYPLWSLMGDWAMFFEVVAGRRPF